MEVLATYGVATYGKRWCNFILRKFVRNNNVIKKRPDLLDQKVSKSIYSRFRSGLGSYYKFDPSKKPR